MTTAMQETLDKWNGTVPQITVPDLLMYPVFHLSTSAAVLGIIGVISFFILSIYFYWSAFSRYNHALTRVCEGLLGMMFSGAAGWLLVAVVTYW